VRRGILARAAIAIVSPIVFFALLEFGVALWGFEYPPADSLIGFVDPNLRVEGGLLHEASARQIWRPRPGAKIPWGTDEKVNAAGFRGPLVDVGKHPGVLRIATLGDSSTFGHSVAWTETYSAQLVAMLAQRGVDAEVVDAGVVGFSIRQGLERYREQVSPYKPDIVIAAFGAVIEHVGALGGVDDDELIRKGVLDQNAWTMKARRLRRDLRSLHFLAWCFDELRGGRVKDQEAWHNREVRQSMLAPEMGKVDWPGIRRVSLGEFEEDILLLRRDVERDGGRLILLSMPHRGKVEKDSPVVLEYEKKIHEIGQREGIAAVDGRAAFGQAVRDKHWIPELMADNFHPSPLGHEYLARALCEEVLRGREPSGQ
jgi:lysophospholipase L1-like esterase